jgi:hypothetical protein
MSDLSTTKPSTGSRGRGRPKDSRYPDAALVEEVRWMLQPPSTYSSLRAAVREVLPRAYRYGNALPESTLRRVVEACRAEFST